MATTTSSVEYIGMNTGDGMSVGVDTTVPIAFYGGTPIVQRSSSSQAIVDTSKAASTQAAAVIVLANELRAALIAVNLIKGSA